MTRNRSTTTTTYEPLRPRLDLHQTITDKIVAAIEAGAGTFQMPWHRPGVALTLPKNAATDKHYRGSNILSLWIDAEEKKFEHQIWATYKQFAELGAQVRKGEKGSLITKYGEWVPRQDASGHPKRTGKMRNQAAQTEQGDAEDAKRLYAKQAWVFNIDQVDAPQELRANLLPPETPRNDLTVRLANVDAFVKAVGVEIREGGQRAFYRHRDSKGEGDFIQMPPRELFTGTDSSSPTESYYATLLHEEIHGSGAEHRLDRKFGEKFGDKAYAIEELVAELGAAFLCAHLEVTNTPRPDHAQYCASWITVLKDDSKAIFSAASLATRSVDYLFGLQPKLDPTPGPETDPPISPASGPLGQPTADAPDRPANDPRDAAFGTLGASR